MTNASIIIQARMSSNRLPKKMMLPISSIPLYRYVCQRCQRIGNIQNTILATSIDDSDNSLVQSALLDGHSVFRGHLYNVLDRYIACAKQANVEIIIRVCGDSPFVDIRLAESLLNHLTENNLDYVSIQKDKCVYGLDSEVVRLSALEKVQSLTDRPDDQEHVTYFIRKNPHLFKAKWLDYDLDPFDGKVSLTVDTIEDLRRCDQIAQILADKFGKDDFGFTSEDIFKIIREQGFVS